MEGATDLFQEARIFWVVPSTSSAQTLRLVSLVFPSLAPPILCVFASPVMKRYLNQYLASVRDVSISKQISFKAPYAPGQD